MAKMEIQFKDPDVIGDFLHEMAEPVLKKLVDAGMGRDEALESKAYEDAYNKLGKLFLYGDYGRVEIDIGPDGTGTAKLLQAK